MNKRVAKPKRKLPLIPDEDVTDAQMEKFLRDNHAEISLKLAEAKRQSDAGMGTPIGSLEEFLAECRRYAKRRR
jgi:hypothetical protein